MSSAIKLDGKKTASENEITLKANVSELSKKTDGKKPCLATILVGEHKPSATYVQMKQRACARVGIESIARHLPQTTQTKDLIKEIHALNDDPLCHGILLQHPVPPQIDELSCFDAIAVEKDVDGVTSLGLAHLIRGLPAYACATPKGILRLLQAYDIALSGLDAVVVGRSAILGKPMAALLTQADATVTLCHSRTRDLEQHVKRAELLVVGIGIAEFIPSHWIRDGAIVVDAGYNPNGKGDVALDASAIQRCRAYTPVPGGVGPMTINTLLNQTVQSATKKLLGT